MIFATQDNTTLIVAAAGNFAELEAVYARAISSEKTFSNEFQPSSTDMWLDDRFQNFKKPPYVFEFDKEDDLKEFAATLSISLVPLFALINKQKQMIADMAEDPYLSPTADKRTIGEIFNLEQVDPWDKRTDEQKQEDEEHRKKAEELKKQGKLSGDSFAPNTRKKTETTVSDIRITHNDDGTFNIDDALAHKGVYEDNGKGAWLPTDEEVARNAARPNSQNEDEQITDAEPNEEFYRFYLTNETCDQIEYWAELFRVIDGDTTDEKVKYIIPARGDHWFVVRDKALAHKYAFLLDFMKIAYAVKIVDSTYRTIADFHPDEAISQHIDTNGWIAIYYRVDAMGASLVKVTEVMIEASKIENKDLLAAYVSSAGQLPDRCWLACATKTAAEAVEKILTDAKIATEIEVYGVNDAGERLVPKGIEIVDEETAIEPPRPWNDRASEWEAMDEDARTKGDERLHGDEFIFCGQYSGPQDGCIVYIAPRKYFNLTGEMWDKSLPIKLPGDFKERYPGIYQSKSRNWLSLCHEFSKIGMNESLALQLYVNNLD
jgi:hypothetical protein